MNNITKIKLINSLIDAVEHFYDLKQKGEDGQKHLKGFCEGMAYTLVQAKALSKAEAKRILQGLGKKHEEIEKRVVEPKEPVIVEKIVEKKEELTPPKIESIPLEKMEVSEKESGSDLDVPTIFRNESNTK